jgi:hypothetical protein
MSYAMESSFLDQLLSHKCSPLHFGERTARHHASGEAGRQSSSACSLGENPGFTQAMLASRR